MSQNQNRTGFSSDGKNGFRVDHRSETETRSMSRETRPIVGGGLEIHREERKVVNLEELKSRETSRIATAEDVRALLEAEFEGIREIQTSREISIEEFNLIESEFKRRMGAKADSETKIKEEHRLENVLESPQWKGSFGVPLSTRNEIVDVREATVVERNYLEPQLIRVATGNVSLQRPIPRAGGEADATAGRMTVTTEYPEGSLRHETKQKRHVIEEVFLEDSDKFYEKTVPKKSRMNHAEFAGIADDVIAREQNKHLLESENTPTTKPRKKKTTQSELVVEDTNLYKDESGRSSHEYKIQPMYTEKAKLVSGQDVDKYFLVDADKEIASKQGKAASPVVQQEIVIGEVKTYREGTMDVDKNRTVEKIEKEENGKTKLFKKRLNQKDTKLLPKLRHKQDEIVINDPTVYDETQFMSLRKAQKKKRLFDNTKTLPAKFGKKSKAQLDREVDLILKRNEEIAEGKHSNAAIAGAPEQVVLEEPDVFRETSTARKKMTVEVSNASLERRRLEKLEQESESRGPQEEIVIDDPEVFREATLTKSKGKNNNKKKKPLFTYDVDKKDKSNKIMDDIMRDIDVLTQEARKSSLEQSAAVVATDDAKTHQKEIVIEDKNIVKENALEEVKVKSETTPGETKVVDETSVRLVDVNRGAADHKVAEAVDQRHGGGVDGDHAHQSEIVVDDRVLFADHNKPKNIQLEHGKAVQIAEMDDFDLPELDDAETAKAVDPVSQAKSEMRSNKKKKFPFKKKKKFQGESVVDESFVYEDAAKIRFPETAKKGESKTGSSGKTFWNWNWNGQNKSQQEVIKDESHYHEDKPEVEVAGDQSKESEKEDATHVAEKSVVTIQPPINFQDVEVTEKDQAKLDGSEPDVVKIETAQRFLGVGKTTEAEEKSEEKEKSLRSDEGSEVDVDGAKERTHEKPKFKIHLPSFTIPKPHLNFGFKKQQQQQESVAEEDKSVVVESLEVKIEEEKLPGVDGDAGSPHGEVVRDQETIVIEENHKTQEVSTAEVENPQEFSQAEVKKEVKVESQKSKFHLPSFTIPKPHLNFGFKKHQQEVVQEGSVALEQESKMEESKPEAVESKAEDVKVVLAKEKAIYKDDVFVEELHRGTKTEVDVAAAGVSAAEELQYLDRESSQGKIEGSPESETKVEGEKVHEHKFKINLPHVPKPHLNIHFKKTKSHEGQDEEIKNEAIEEKTGEKEQEEREAEEVGTANGAKKEKFKIMVPQISLHVPHIHFASMHGKQEEVVVDDKSIIPSGSKVLVAEENLHEEDAGPEIKGDLAANEQVIHEVTKQVPESTEVIDKSDETVVVVEDAKKLSEEVVDPGRAEFDSSEISKDEPPKEVSTLDGKSKKKIKFNFPHFSLPRSHAKQNETVAGEAVIVEDSTKLKMTEKKVEADELSEEASIARSEELGKDKKSDQQQHKFKLRFPKPHFKFGGFKGKDKHKSEKVQESKEEVEVERHLESKVEELKTPDKEETTEDAQVEFLTAPCKEEFTETVKYILDAGEEIPTAPVTIRVDPDEYKTVVGKNKLSKEVDTAAEDAVLSVPVESKIEESSVFNEAQLPIDVPYYEYEPNDKGGESVEVRETSVALETEAGAAGIAEVDGQKAKTIESEIAEASEKEPEEKKADETEQEAKPKEETVSKSKSKFHFPCIKMKKPFLKKHGEQEPSSEDDPAYGEADTEELREQKVQEAKSEEEKTQDADKSVTQTNEREGEKSDKLAKKKHKVFNMKSLGRKSHQGEVVVNDAHIYTDNSTLGRRLLNKFRHKVTPESGAFILENNLPESSESEQKAERQPIEEQIVQDTKQVALEAEGPRGEDGETPPKEVVVVHDELRVEEKTSPDADAGRGIDSSIVESSKASAVDSLTKHKKQDELIVGGDSIITEPQTPKHRVLHKQHAKTSEQTDKTSSQDLPDSEKVIRKKDHGKLTSLFHRTSGEYDMEPQKRTNQPLVELISSRPKLNGEAEISATSATLEESSWSMTCRKNLTLDSSNHLAFETEYDPDESRSTENVQLFCPSTRRSYRKQIQIDDLDLIKAFEATASNARDKAAFDTSTPVKRADESAVSTSSGIKPDPVKWTSSMAKNTSYFSTLPEFETVDDRQRSPHFVVVAIDFGTTFSGYAFSFKNDVDSIHIMRKWEGGDPGVVNQKTPTTLLLTPDKEFHSFGFTARDFYHDLSPKEAKRWLYFEKFKMALHYSTDLTSETEIQAANGVSFKAQEIFGHALRFFKNHALQEIGEQTGTELVEDDVKWVITVPAIWKAPAKQFMREAAYKAGIASASRPEQLIIALEPEAASIFVRKQRLRQLIPEEIDDLKDARRAKSNQDVRAETSSPVLLDTIAYQTHLDESSSWSQSVASNALSMSFQRCPSPTSFPVSIGHEVDITDNRFMVADCGGGTVDITVYEMLSATGGKLKELYKASGGPYGSIGVDLEFEKLLVSIFDRDFIETFKLKRPAGWVDLMMAFESRKRAANPFKTKPLNVSLPFSFIDYYRKFKNATVESAIRKYNHKEVKWSSQGMMRLMPECMNALFQPTLDNITESISNVMRQQDVSGVKHIFLVGGFAESPMLQQEIRKNFAHQARILIPTDVSLTILKGAVLYGIDPTIVVIRKSRLTYGLGVLNRFVEGKHPDSKKAMKDGVPWCVDVFDHLVLADQSVALGSSVIRSYTPAEPNQKFSLFHIYCTESREVDYVTDEGVVKCGTLRLDLDDHQWELESNPSRPVSQQLTGRDLETSQSGEGTRARREIQARLTFGDTEIKIIALDVATGNYVRATLDFLNK